MPRIEDLHLTSKILAVRDLFGTGYQRIFGNFEDLILKGSINEDAYPTVANVRTHFHDPVTNQGAPVPTQPHSALYRAIGNDPLFGWDWIDAREFFRLGLTSPTRTEREENLGRTFYSLGRIAHLLQDMAVPAHVRNDLHDFVNIPKVYVNKDIYELFWQNRSTIPVTQETPLSFPRLSDFWDGELVEVNYLNPDPGNGLAEFTNRHFLSQDTNFGDETPFFYPYQKEQACEPYTVVEEPRGEPISVDYYRCTFQDHTDNRSFTIQHMTANSIFDFELGRKTLFRERVFSLNNRCFEDYGNVLIPKAIRYTAGLFDYFFRGSFEAPAGQSFVETLSADSISLHIKNSSSEAMTNGTLYLYQDDGDEAVVGTDNRLRDNPNTAAVASWPAGQVYQGSAFQNVWVWLPVGKKLEDITFTLVFIGQLGNEQGAVVAKRFKAPAPPAGLGRHVYAVGRNPTGIALTPDGSRLLVANYGDDTVSVFDARGTERLALIPVGDGPYDIAIAGEAGRYAFVSNELAYSISIIDLQSLSVTGTFTGLPANPREIAATADGRSVYCAHWSATNWNLSRIDVNAMTIALLNENLDFWHMMTGLALHPSRPVGYGLYYAYMWRKSVGVFDTNSNGIIVNVPGPDLNRSGAVESEGTHLYYVSKYLDQVSRLETEGNIHVLPAIALESGSNAMRVSAGSDRTVYVTLYGKNKVRAIEGSDGAVRGDILDAGLSGPTEVAVSPDNKTLYISSSLNNSVLRVPNPFAGGGNNAPMRTMASIAVSLESTLPAVTYRLGGLPYEADVRVDGWSAPQEAYENAEHVLSGISAGAHVVEIISPGYRPWRQQVSLEEGDNYLVPGLEVE